jgi:hypothetical protein
MRVCSSFLSATISPRVPICDPPFDVLQTKCSRVCPVDFLPDRSGEQERSGPMQRLANAGRRCGSDDSILGEVVQRIADVIDS